MSVTRTRDKAPVPAPSREADPEGPSLTDRNVGCRHGDPDRRAVRGVGAIVAGVGAMWSIGT